MGNLCCKCCYPDGYQSPPYTQIQSVAAQPPPLPVVVGKLNDPLYINWLKATRGLSLTVGVLCQFCDVEMKTLHGQLVNTCGGNTQCSGSCSATDVKKVRGKLTVVNCPTGVCSKWLTEIEKECTSSNIRLNYPNAVILDWPRHHWQVAKVYMGWGQDASSVMSSDTDASGILALIRNCGHFRNIIDTTKADAVREKRNFLMHHTSMQLSGQELSDVLLPMTELLNDLHQRHNDPAIPPVVADIQQIKQASVDITDKTFLSNERNAWHQVLSSHAVHIHQLYSDTGRQTEDISQNHTEISQLHKAVKANRELAKRLGKGRETKKLLEKVQVAVESEDTKRKVIEADLRRTEEARQSEELRRKTAEEDKKKLSDDLRRMTDEAEQAKEQLQQTEEAKKKVEEDKKKLSDDLRLMTDEAEQAKEQLRQTEEAKKRAEGELMRTEEAWQTAEEKVQVAVESEDTKRKVIEADLRRTEEARKSEELRRKTAEEQLRQTEEAKKTAEEDAKRLSDELRVAKEETVKVKEDKKKLSDDLRLMTVEAEQAKEDNETLSDDLKRKTVEAEQAKEENARLKMMKNITGLKRPTVPTRPANRQLNRHENELEKKTQILHAIALLRDRGKLNLWSTAYSHLLTNGTLDLDRAITNVQQLQDLKALFASGSATNITALTMDYCGLSGDEFTAMLGEVSRLQQLRKLRLYNNDLHGRPMSTLKGSLLTLKNLDELDLSYGQMDDNDVITLSAALPSLPSLDFLGLGGNSVGDAGALHITKEAIKMASHQSISIWLPNNLLTEAGIQKLRDVAKGTPRLWLACLDWQRPASEDALCPDDVTFWQQRVNSLQTALSRLQARPQLTDHMQQDTGVIKRKLAASKDSLRKVQSQRNSSE